MNKLINLVCLLALACAALAGSSAHAQADGSAAAVPNPAHAKALREILAIVRDPELAAYSLRKEAAIDKNNDLFASFVAQADREKLILMMLPVYAKHVPQAQAVQLASILGQAPLRRVHHYLAEREMVPAAKKPSLGQNEYAMVSSVDSTPSMRAWRAAQPQIAADLKKALRTWIVAYYKGIDDRAAVSVKKAIDAIVAGGNTIQMDWVGIPSYDKLIKALLEAQLSAARATRDYEAGLDEIKLNEVLLPANVVGKAEIQRGRTALDDSERLLERLIGATETAIREREDATRRIDFAGKQQFLHKFEQTQIKSYSKVVKFGEAQRRVINALRAHLDFYESRHGRFKVEGNVLLYETEEDLRLANELSKDLDAAILAAKDQVDEK